jgi:hypothetical protein
MDLVVRNVLVGEGSAFFAGGNTTLAGLDAATETVNGATVNVDRPKIDDFRKIVLGMKRAYLKGNRQAGGRYIALISPEVMFQLFDDQRMRDYMDFGQTNAAFGDGMVIDMFGIRFVEVLNAPIVDNGTVLAHDSIVIGEEAYAITKLQGQGVRVITKGLGSAGVEDPLEQRQSIGYKMTGFSAKVLNNEAVVNYWSVPGDFEADLQEPLEDDIVYVTFVSGETGNADTPINFRNSVVPIASGATLQEAVDVANITFTVDNQTVDSVEGKELAFAEGETSKALTDTFSANAIITVTLVDAA